MHESGFSSARRHGQEVYLHDQMGGLQLPSECSTLRVDAMSKSRRGREPQSPLSLTPIGNRRRDREPQSPLTPIESEGCKAPCTGPPDTLYLASYTVHTLGTYWPFGAEGDSV